MTVAVGVMFTNTTINFKKNHLRLNPLSSDGFSHTDKCNKDWGCPLYILRGQRLEFSIYDLQ